MSEIQFIAESEVAGVLTMRDLIPRMAKTMASFSRGDIQQPVRRILEVSPHGGYFSSMPAVSADGVGAKLVAFYPSNSGKGLDTHMGLLVVFEPETGKPLAVMDGRLITEMRTAAVTAAFVDAVAPSDVQTLTIMGAGVQARSHIEALNCVRSFNEIRIWNRTRERAEILAQNTGARVVDDAGTAVEGADVVVTATSSPEPIIDGDWLKPGVKLASVGFGGFDGGELDAKTMSNTVIVDSREGALSEPKHVHRYNAEIYAELGEIISGDKTVPLEATVVFDSLGMACQDIASAALVMELL